MPAPTQTEIALATSVLSQNVITLEINVRSTAGVVTTYRYANVKWKEPTGTNTYRVWERRLVSAGAFERSISPETLSGLIDIGSDRRVTLDNADGKLTPIYKTGSIDNQIATLRIGSRAESIATHFVVGEMRGQQVDNVLKQVVLRLSDARRDILSGTTEPELVGGIGEQKDEPLPTIIGGAFNAPCIPYKPTTNAEDDLMYKFGAPIDGGRAYTHDAVRVNGRVLKRTVATNTFTLGASNTYTGSAHDYLVNEVVVMITGGSVSETAFVVEATATTIKLSSKRGGAPQDYAASFVCKQVKGYRLDKSASTVQLSFNPEGQPVTIDFVRQHYSGSVTYGIRALDPGTTIPYLAGYLGVSASTIDSSDLNDVAGATTAGSTHQCVGATFEGRVNKVDVFVQILSPGSVIWGFNRIGKLRCMVAKFGTFLSGYSGQIVAIDYTSITSVRPVNPKYRAFSWTYNNNTTQLNSVAGILTPEEQEELRAPQRGVATGSASWDAAQYPSAITSPIERTSFISLKKLQSPLSLYDWSGADNTVLPRRAAELQSPPKLEITMSVPWCWFTLEPGNVVTVDGQRGYCTRVYFNYANNKIDCQVSAVVVPS